MRVLLTHPPLQPGRPVMPPLGLCTLASWLLAKGHEVRILDLDLEVKLAPGNPRETFRSAFLREVEDFEPAVVSVTSMYNNSYYGEQLIRFAKRLRPGTVTMAGGSHFGALGPESLRRIPELDYVIEGEGESAFSGLLTCLLGNAVECEIPRLCYRKNGGIHRNPSGALLDLTTLPPMWVSLGNSLSIPAYTSTIPEASGRRLIYIEAGRGCPFACSFCGTAPFWERKYRVKSIPALVEEMRFLCSEYGYDSFTLVHDLLTVDARFVSDFCDAMLEARLPVEWMANSRIDLPSRGLLPKMKAAGCWKLFFGVESASPRIQEQIDKHLTTSNVFETVQELGENGMSATCSFVIGFPEESPRELWASIKLGAQLKLMGVETVQLHRLRLWPPAPLSQRMLPSEFDELSLRIEHPFLSVTSDEIECIKEDPFFYQGYFAPCSRSGASAQLAQVEMFFHHALAIAPLTISVLTGLLGDQLIPSFYAALEKWGGLSREELDWESGNLYHNWSVVSRWLMRWLSRELGLRPWEREVAAGVISYEECRIQFVTHHRSEIAAPGSDGANWLAFESTVDLPLVLESGTNGIPVSEKALRPMVILLTRTPNGDVSAYVLSRSLSPAVAAKHLGIEPGVVYERE